MKYNLAGRKRMPLSAFLLISTVAMGQWSGDPTINTPVCVTDSFQIFPQVITDGTGGSIIVWQDFRGGPPDIYAQRLDADGFAMWATNGVAVSAAAQSQTSPQIVSDGLGGGIIAWRDTRNSAVGDIYAQRISPTGALLWPVAGVAVCTAANEQIAIAMEADGAGGAIITWNDLRGGNINAYDIYAQRLNSAGTPQWTANGVIVAGNTFQNDFKLLLADGSGGVFVAWNRRTGAAADVMAQRLNSAGVRQWAVAGVPVCTATGDQLLIIRESICSDNAGGMILSWSDARAGSVQDIYAQRLSSDGAVQWQVNGLPVSTAAGNQFLPSVLADGAGGAFIGFQLGENGARTIHAQRLNSAGAPQWGLGGVSVCTASGDRTNRSLVSDNAGGVIMVWQDDRNLDFTDDVYAQRLNAEGALQWKADGQPIGTADGAQFVGLAFPMIPNGAGGAVVVWEDGRPDGFGIYAGRVDANGNLNGVSAAASVLTIW